MPYRQNNYSFVIDSSFRPFSFQEMLAPYSIYKEEAERAESAYNDLTKGAMVFNYLAENVDPDSKAAQIYNGYANELKTQAEDLTKNGLTMGNRRALSSLKQRYEGEIGRLERADKILQEELKKRRDEKDTSMLYGTNNLNIDMFLDNNSPNLYRVSGNDLMSLGESMGKAVSSRQYDYGEAGSMFGNQYNIFKETQGIRPEELNEWMMTAGNELADRILAERGATENLSGAEYARAKQSVLNGIYSGIVYNESVKPYANGEYRSAAERDSSARGWASIAMQKEERDFNRRLNGLSKDENGNPVYDKDKDINRQVAVEKAEAVARAKQTNGSGSSSSSGKSKTDRYTLLNKGVKLSWNGNNPNPANGNADNDVKIEDITNDQTEHIGVPVSYDELPAYMQQKVDAIIGSNGNVDMYTYYYRPFESSFWGDTEASLEIVPQKSVIFNGESSDLFEDDSDLED